MLPMPSNTLTEIAIGLPPMILPAASASAGTADSALAVEQSDAGVDALVTLPTVRMQIDARGLALGLLAAFATIFLLSWAQCL